MNFLNSNALNLKIKDFTKSAFVQKRRKINPEVFKYLTTVISDNFYVENNPGFDSLYGYRILAVDGSKISLPFTEELKGAFGVISLYAKGMTVSDIEEQIREVYKFDISTSTISRITESVSNDVIAWQNRPLEAVYLIVWMDGIVFKVRENSKVINKTKPVVHYKKSCSKH